MGLKGCLQAPDDASKLPLAGAALSRGPAAVTELLRTTSVVGATGSGGSWTLPREALDELGLSLATAEVDDAARAFVLRSFGAATTRGEGRGLVGRERNATNDVGATARERRAFAAAPVSQAEIDREVRRLAHSRRTDNASPREAGDGADDGPTLDDMLAGAARRAAARENGAPEPATTAAHRRPAPSRVVDRGGGAGRSIESEETAARPRALCCPFYVRGACRFGSSCTKRHRRVVVEATAAPRGAAVCYWFASGAGCRDGNACRFRHCGGGIASVPRSRGEERSIGSR